MVKGLPIISPFFRGGFFREVRIEPPLINSISRRFTKTNANILPDVIGGRNADIIGSTSGTYLKNTDNVKIDFTYVQPGMPAYEIFNKSNRSIWKESAGTGTVWNVADLNQQFIYDNIQDSHKYHLWIKVVDGEIRDIFYYEVALTGVDICKSKDYVHLGESYLSIYDPTQICKIDTIIEASTILESGIWDDAGVWDDNSLWKDSK